MRSTPDYRVVQLRHYDPRTFESLDRLHRALIHGSSTPPEQFMDFVTQRLGDETTLLILGLAGDAPVGYALAFDVARHAFMPEWQRSGYITQFFVASEHRRQGVGQLMFDYVIQWLASRGVTDVLLNVELDNPVGELFWRKQGFVPHRIRMRRAVTENTTTPEPARDTGDRVDQTWDRDAMTLPTGSKGVPAA
jgi:GNAT superfamily N-acetyltransferase